jgi:hypothetical protein
LRRGIPVLCNARGPRCHDWTAEMSDDFADDDSHPIPKVNVIDVSRNILGGGAAYGLVIARPIGADERSMRRLAMKIESYVEDFFSKESGEARGTPKPGKMWIYVHVHVHSSRRSFDLIKEYEPWIVDNGIKLIVNTIDDDGQLRETISRAGYES